ncbi:SusC/RagA family TonB-linked outer membrane protein [Paraflavitalea sp. CAU 1676]|uniref:SusC/RagA family TonB-linked outer membrane protein n=1 Tax=Paraflavitalea sp. CAU 1676 TaxID=3032598 RepID=UPI0023DB6906|nr:SusC/RagA family TonB-linked outer membrane protein [Paraflavitalea sp. CAU 1676]MDF2192245.1 SusC/RagA family TonB-linked outer membrane protein [Paraflavitalea sp. CAU 1676]
MRKILSLFTALVTCAVMAFGQSRPLTGQVNDSKGDPIPFATIKVKGTDIGAAADASGKFSINVQDGAVLVITATGYGAKEVPVGSGSTLNAVLQSSGAMQEVVVTAMGVTKSKRAVGVAVQDIQGDKLMQTKQTDLNTALAGRVAGVQILGGSGAKFGTSTVRIRGVNTLGTGNPLYVINGVPTDGRDVNMDDVESVSVLKGPAATALYGQRGSEGVIVITTKKGKKNAGIGLEFNQSTTFERVATLPKYQNEYGGGYYQDWYTFKYDPSKDAPALAAMDGAKYYDYFADESWGPKMDGTLYAPWYSWDPEDPDYAKLKPFVAQKDNIRDFYETGVAYNTNVAFSKVTDNSNTRVSFTNLSRTGVSPNSRQTKNWLSINNSIDLTKKFSLNTNINYVYEFLFNVPTEGYGTQTAGSFNQWFQRNLEMDKLKRYKRTDGSYTSWNVNGPRDLSPKFWDNPYTEVYENISNNKRQRIYGNIGGTYKFNSHLKATVLARADVYNQNFDSRVASGTLNLDAFRTYQNNTRELNFVGSVEYDNEFGDLSLRAGAYAEKRSNYSNYVNEATAGGLTIPNYYNIAASKNRPTTNNTLTRSEVRSAYGYVSLGWRNFLFLDLNTRNDWSSALPISNNSYLYGGVASSFVFTELLPQNDILSFGKLRASVARVGSDLAAYNVYQTYTVGTPYDTYPTLSVPNTIPNNTLKPALSTAYEVGTELRFLRNRIRFDFNYYSRETKDQILNLTIPSTTGYSAALVNAGNIANHGIEINLGGTPVRTKDLSWDIDINFGYNRNEVKSLYGESKNLAVNPAGLGSSFGFVGTPGISVNARVGETYGMLIGTGYKRNESGQILVDDEGIPLLEQNKELGSILPDFTGGVFNEVTYKNFTLGFSIDFQKGGKLMSLTSMINAGSGLSQLTVGNNDKGNPKRDAVDDGGGVRVDGVRASDGKTNNVYIETKDYYETVLSSLWEEWVYDATFVKLREVRLGYNLPKRWYQKLNIQNANFSVIAQNPWLIYSTVKGIDPSQLQTPWMDSGQLPGTRTLGFNLKLQF